MQLLPIAVGFAAAFAITGGILWLNMRKNKSKGEGVGALMALYRAGDFEGMLRTLEASRNRSMEVEYLYLRGAALRQLGRFDEAEKTLTQCIAQAEQESQAYGRSAQHAIQRMEKLIRIGSSASQSLSSVYLEQGRYRESLEALEASLRDGPERSSARRDMAEIYLRQGNVREGLKLAEQAVERGREESFASKAVSDLTLSTNLATLAWASALAHADRDHVEQLVAEAVTLIPTEYPTVASQVFLHIGYACEELGDLVQARERFSSAAAEDANGLTGRAARNALASLNA